MNVVCPHCGSHGSAEDSLAGRMVSCPQCKGEFVITGVDASFHEEEPLSSEVHPVTDDAKERHDDSCFVSSELTVLGVLKDSWQLSRDRRFALVCRVGMLLLIFAMAGVALVIDSENGLVMNVLRKLSMPEALLSVAGVVLTLVHIGLSGNAEAGLPYLGIRHGIGYRIGLQTCFRGFSPDRFKQLFLAGMMKTVLMILGFLFLFFPGIYLIFAYWFALPLILDRGLDAWEALELSRQTVTRVWFQVFGIYFTMGMISYGVPGMLLGYRLAALFEKIGEQKAEELSLSELYSLFPGDFHLIGILVFFLVALWFFLLPWFVASYGVLYKKLFGTKNNE